MTSILPPEFNSTSAPKITRTYPVVPGHTPAPPVDRSGPLRPVDAIMADLEHPYTRSLLQVRTAVDDGPIGRLLRDVEPLLADVERLQGRRSVVEYDAERDTVSGVRALLSTLGASDVAVDWRYVHTLALQMDASIARAEAAEAKVRAIELVHVWTNEDGRRFMFVDDVARALGLPV